MEIQQSPGSTLYAFAVDGKQIPLFAAVSRVGRDEQAKLRGYQRPEVVNHVASIKKYVESRAPMLPNSIVIAFDERVRFEPVEVESSAVYSRHGVLVIPVDEDADDDAKAGWIVDGQQRTAAIREARVDEFPVCVTAFVTADVADQRSQFILVNSTKPLPKGLIYELLPTTKGELPAPLKRKRFPSLLLDRLNFDPGSPLQGRIRTTTTPEGLVKDNSVLKMLENSLNDGALYHFRDPETGEGEQGPMLAVLFAFWRAVATVFPEPWDLPPRRSRLVHGVGIVSLGYVMDAIAEDHLPDRLPTEADFTEALEALAPVCRWTSGYWSFDGDTLRRWNNLQNTPRDIQALADYLLREHRRLARGRSASR